MNVAGGGRIEEEKIHDGLSPIDTQIVKLLPPKSYRGVAGIVDDTLQSFQNCFQASVTSGCLPQCSTVPTKNDLTGRREK